jgi:hypothetical protein
VLVRDMESGLDFEIAKSDIDRIITSDGRSVQFGEDNIPSLGAADGRPTAFGGRSRVRYSLRWGADAAPCTNLARDFAPGRDVVIRHLRGAPMLKLEFVGGQEFNAAVRADGLFETVIVAAARPGPAASQVQTRISGRLARGGGVRGVARLIAVTNDGQTLCDLALTMQGAPVP